jgi:hypothetical protein
MEFANGKLRSLEPPRMAAWMPLYGQIAKQFALLSAEGG